MADQRLSRKMFNICIVCVIIIAIIFVAMILILNYGEKGETNMPFDITKISVISTVNGEDVENSENKWDINVIQNNDIYIYVEKNQNYRKQETISSIKLDNFFISQPSLGEVNLYKPISDETTLFKNSEDNKFEVLEFKGAKTTDTRNLQISNQGGVICFRGANSKVGNYKSNDDVEINYNELIQKLDIVEENLQAKIKFDITITLDSGKVFKAEKVEVIIPNENLGKEGTVGKEYTDLQDIIFKRIEN